MKLMTLSFLVLCYLYVTAIMDRAEAEAQRDEAFELARKHQEASCYWFNCNLNTVAHYAAKENR